MPFQIVRNDITKMHVDAIVNTANPMPGYGAGIDSAVYEAAGKDKLLAKRQEIGAIDSMLKDVDYNLTKTDQDSLIKRKKMLQDELKYQQQMYEERVIAFQKALDKKLIIF